MRLLALQDFRVRRQPCSLGTVVLKDREGVGGPQIPSPWVLNQSDIGVDTGERLSETPDPVLGLIAEANLTLRGVSEED